MIRSRLGGLLAVLALFLPAGPSLSAEAASSARPPVDAEAQKAQLADVVADFGNAFRTKDSASVVAAIPPRFIAFVAKQVGVTPGDLRSTLADDTAKTMREAEVLSFAIDVENAKYQTLADGSVIALVPTETVMRVDGQKYQANSDTLAITEGGRWYLMRVGSAQQIQVLRDIYPELSSVHLSSPKMKAVGL